MFEMSFYRAAFEALQATAVRAAELEDIVKGLEHLVAELNHVVHGKKSEKLSEDDRQLAFEDLKIALAEAEEQKQTQAPGIPPIETVVTAPWLSVRSFALQPIQTRSSRRSSGVTSSMPACAAILKAMASTPSWP